MNEPNLPEELMRGWTPRRPSTSRKRNIFSRANSFSEPTETLSPASAKFYWGAFAPTMACALLTLLAFHRNGDESPTASALIWSGSNFVADSSHSAQNHWASVTFDWTNHSVFQSSIGFTPTTNLSH